MGRICWRRASSWNSRAPWRLPWSVTARESIPRRLTWLTSSRIWLAPSRREYSLWVWRCTNAIPGELYPGRASLSKVVVPLTLRALMPDPVPKGFAMPFSGQFRLPAALLVLAACSGGSSGPSAAACTDHVDLDLAPGGYRLVDATNESACLRFPAGGAEQEYLVVSYSGSGEEASAGISGGYR